MKNGGSAFPLLNGYTQQDSRTNTTGYLSNSYSETGLSIRDYFAASALTGILAGQKSWILSDGEDTEIQVTSPVNYSIIAYRIADCMLAEREKQE